MALDEAQLEKLLCAEVRIHRRQDDVLMVESPFTFPDGDHFPIYLSETAGGGVRLSDRGHTLMHVSFASTPSPFPARCAGSGAGCGWFTINHFTLRWSTRVASLRLVIGNRGPGARNHIGTSDRLHRNAHTLAFL